MKKIQNWKTECLISHRLVEVDFKGKDLKEIKEIFDNAWIDYKNYSSKRLKTCHINVFDTKYVKSYSDTVRNKVEFDKENSEYHKHISDNLALSRNKNENKL